MKLEEFAQEEIERVDINQLTMWLEKQSLSKRNYKKLLEDFQAIVVMQQAGFYEQADERFAQWKNNPVPIEMYRYRMAIAARAGGKMLAKKRFMMLPDMAKNHNYMKPWKKQLRFSPWMMAGAAAAVAVVIGMTQIDFSGDTQAEAVEQKKNEQQITALSKEVKVLKQDNEQLTGEVKKQKAQVVQAKQSALLTLELKEAKAAIDAKRYSDVDRLLSKEVLRNPETASTAAFYQLKAKHRSYKSIPKNYTAYIEAYPKSSHVPAVLWMKAFRERALGQVAYKETLKKLANLKKGPAAAAAQDVLSGKRTLNDQDF